MIQREIYAIWLREVKKALSDKWSLVVSVILPLVIIFVIGIGIDSFVNLKNLGINYTDFLGPGVIAIMSMGGALSIGHSIIEDKKGFIKEMLVAPISRASIFIGKILGEITVYFVLTLIVVLIFLTFIKSLSLVAVLWTLLFMVLIAFGFYGLGIVLSFLFSKSKTYNVINGLIMSYLIFLSGAFFPVKGLPMFLKIISLVNPLTYGVDALRNIITGYGEFNLFFNLLFLIIFGVLMVAIGSFAFKRTIEA